MTQPNHTKTLPIRIPQELWEDFYRVFPGRGERTQFLLKCIVVAVDLGKEEKFEEKVVRRLFEEE